MQTAAFKTSPIRRMVPLLFVVAGASIAATTWGGGNCPDRGIKIVDSKTTLGPPQQCGSGIVVKGGPLTVHGGKTQCPTFVIYEPPYHAPTDKVGFEAVPGELVPITIFSYRCATRWLFGWFPIPIGSSCRLDKTRSGGSVQNYIERSCNSLRSRGEGNGGRGNTGR